MTDAFENEGLNPILDAVAAAEEIADPLDGLVKRVADNPGAPSYRTCWPVSAR